MSQIKHCLTAIHPVLILSDFNFLFAISFFLMPVINTSIKRDAKLYIFTPLLKIPECLA